MSLSFADGTEGYGHNIGSLRNINQDVFSTLDTYDLSCLNKSKSCHYLFACNIDLGLDDQRRRRKDRGKKQNEGCGKSVLLQQLDFRERERT